MNVEIKYCILLLAKLFTITNRVERYLLVFIKYSVDNSDKVTFSKVVSVEHFSRNI